MTKPEAFYRLQKDRTAFAKKIGISQGYYSEIMRGKKTGKLKILDAICKASKGQLVITDFIND